MALTPCSACKRRTLGRLISIYTARFSEQQRVAFRTQLCFECAADWAETLRAAKPLVGDSGFTEWPDTCSMCGSATKDDLDPIYVTVFEPKQEGRALTVASCARCTSNLAPQLEQYGTRLVDRNPSGPQNGAIRPATGEGAPSPLAWA